MSRDFTEASNMKELFASIDKIIKGLDRYENKLKKRMNDLNSTIQDIQIKLFEESKANVNKRIKKTLRPYNRYLSKVKKALFEIADADAYDEMVVEPVSLPDDPDGIFSVLDKALENVEEKITELSKTVNFTERYSPIDVSVHKKKVKVQKEGEEVTFKAPKIDLDPFMERLDDSEDLRPLMKALKSAELKLEEAFDRFKDYWSLTTMEEVLTAETKKVKEEEIEKLKRDIEEAKFKELSVIEEKIIAFLNKFKEQISLYETDFDNGSRDFNKKIVIGRLNIPYKGKLFERSKHLQSIMEFLPTDKKTIKVPYAMDLEKNSSMVIETNLSKHQSTVQLLTHQIILQFLLSFPAEYLRLCLIDVKEKARPELFNDLKSIDEKVIMDRIVISKDDVSDALKKLEDARWDIQANKLANSGADDVYEYNEASRSNPEPFHLLVIYNYPEGIKENDYERLEKIIELGPKSGIYTLIVHNTEATNEAASGKSSHFKHQPSSNTVLDIVNHAIERGIKFKVSGNKEFTITERGQKPIEDSYAFMNKDRPLTLIPYHDIRPSDIRQAIKVLRKNKEETSQEVIPVEEMFEHTEKELEEDLVKSPFKVLDIPVGKKGSNIQKLRFNTEGNDVHAIMIGGTGSGKSNFLHTLLLSAAYRYSPTDLNVYLVDFKGGVEFDSYRFHPLPHVRLAALTNEQEDGVAVLSKIEKILSERESLFRKQGNTSSIDEYNQAVSKKHRIPRILVIIDEVQYLFKQSEVLAQKVVEILSGILNKGRAFGISILWASQNIPKTTHAVGVRSEIIGKIRNRIVLKLNDPSEGSDLGMDHKKIKAIESGERGVGLISDARNNYNETEFRVAFAKKAIDREAVIDSINNRWVKEKPRSQTMHLVGNDAIPVLANKPSILKTPVKPPVSKSNKSYSLALGENYVTGEEMVVPLTLRQSNAHIWLNGFDQSQMKNVLGWMAFSILYNHLSNRDFHKHPSPIYLADGDHETKDDDLLNVLEDTFDGLIQNVSDSKTLLSTVADLFKIRQERSKTIRKTYVPIFLIFNRIQSFRDLINDDTLIDLENPKASLEAPASDSKEKSNDDSMFFSPNAKRTPESKGEKKFLKDMLKTLLKQGSDVGIHLVFSFDRLSTLSDFEREIEMFTTKILFKGVNENDMMNLMPRETNRYLRNLRKEVGLIHHQGEMIKFKPYHFKKSQDMPYIDSLKKIADKLEGLENEA